MSQNKIIGFLNPTFKEKESKKIIFQGEKNKWAKFTIASKNKDNDKTIYYNCMCYDWDLFSDLEGLLNSIVEVIEYTLED